jgi:hypothetical protein
MGEDRVGRRAVLGGGASLLASLAGCGGLFIEPETTTTATPVAEETPTATPAPTVAPTTTATPTPVPLPGDVVEVRDRRFSLEPSRLERFTFVDYRFEVENVGQRPIRSLEFRVRVRYVHDEFSRVVGAAYPRVRFDADDDGENDEDREGLQVEETDPVTGRLRFERDGRAERSTAADRFDLELSVRRIRYV